ncbi:activin receptor type-2B-like [Littorina saxatilis]|uniref:Serine/threonine-protein kinase receptor n=1 Tax=Littorina saxatilis TaxID=31220 RepID=A0AAN9G2P4_9CAEN
MMKMTLSKALRSWPCLLILPLLFQRSLAIFPQSDPSSEARTDSNEKPDAVINIQCEKFPPEETKCDPGVPNCVQKPGVMTCDKTSTPSGRNFCFASWINGTDGIHVVKKGCWSNDPDCEGKRSCERRPGPSVRGVYFCCCEGDLCNRNISFQSNLIHDTETPVSTTTASSVRKENESQVLTVILCSIVPIIGFAVTIVVLFFVWQRHRRSLYTGHEQLPTVEPGYVSTPSDASLNLDKVKLIELRARGRFGSVWKAQLVTDYVAVKIFPLQEKQSWMTEQEIYNLPQMSHDNVLRFIASEKRGENLNIELWLLTEFHENGSLYDYLKAHVLTWSQICKIAETVASGLAFLHDEIPPTSTLEAKPAVAHRDFKSKNVLLKSDLSACVADFGLALKFEPGKAPGETHGLVGTRRYMAPEVLEGAICFNRDAFLRIDMYACGLVLWELLTRCNAAEGPVGEYQLPFEAVQEVGQHPSLETMQEYVVNRKMRPLLHDHWKRHPGMASIASTIEECWDQDAEARLSAGCVQERIAALTRTLNSTGTAGGAPPIPPPLPTSMPPPLGLSPPRSGDSVISFSTSSDIPPKDLSSC